MCDKGTAYVHLPTPSLRKDKKKDQDPRDGVREWRAINILRLFERKRVPGSWKTGALATQGMEPCFFVFFFSSCGGVRRWGGCEGKSIYLCLEAIMSVSRMGHFRKHK